MKLVLNVKGKDRKALAAAIAQFLEQEAVYQRGFDTYRIGEYTVDKEGTLTGPDNTGLGAWLAEKGFAAAVQPDDIAPAPEPDPEDAAETGTESDGDVEPSEAGQPSETQEPSGGEEHSDAGRLTIEMPMAGFTPEKLENLRKLVDSKASLIKKALGVDELPIITTEAGTVGFPWFRPDLDSESITAYSQFVAALCKTAREKTRVTAQIRDFPNEKFSLRVFSIGLGLIGPEYRLIRKLLSKNLSGNSAWSSGIDPRRKTESETSDGNVTDTCVDDANDAYITGEGGDAE